jgi:hypothetical protein
VLCKDGVHYSGPGPCERKSDGTCGYTWLTCPNTTDPTCTTAECGPAPGAPNVLCKDGVHYSGPGPCERKSDGTCGYTWMTCPNTTDPTCTTAECGPAPGAPVQLCQDGVHYSGPGPCERKSDGTCGYTWKTCPTSTNTTCTSYYKDCNICLCNSDGSYKCTFTDCYSGRCTCSVSVSTQTDIKSCPDSNYITGVSVCTLSNGVCESHIAQCPATFKLVLSAKGSADLSVDTITTIGATSLNVSVSSINVKVLETNSDGSKVFVFSVAENTAPATDSGSTEKKLQSDLSKDYIVQNYNEYKSGVVKLGLVILGLLSVILVS